MGNARLLFASMILGCAAAGAACGQPATQPGVTVLAGGGGEGRPGDSAAWSARLYPALLSTGDVSGDGVVRVALIAAREQSQWLPEYFRALGASDALNVIVASTEQADDPHLDPLFDGIDAVFIKGGNQGRYYDLWNERGLERNIRSVLERGGSIGGTSAGAMSLAQFALAGGRGPNSEELLAEPCGSGLEDTDGGSALHADFFGFVEDVIIDTHFSQRDRLGRLIAALAKLADETGNRHVVGIGIDEQTGLVIDRRQGALRVIGNGTVSFIAITPGSRIVREFGKPLTCTDARLQMFSDGAVLRGAERASDDETGGAAATQPAGAHLDVINGQILVGARS